MSFIRGSARFRIGGCHRLDRNTGGIVILAKNEETYNAVVSLMDENQIVKTYSALCFGNVKQEKKARDGFTTLKAYHFKDAKKGMVYIYDFPKKYCKEIIKKYSLACSSDERFGGELSHVVVMQHVTKERIDAFIQALVKSKKE